MASKTAKIHCNCGQGTGYGTCKNCSRIKIVVLTKGNYPNLTRYSFYSKNRKNVQTIINDLWSKIQNQPAFLNLQFIQKVKVYEWNEPLQDIQILN